MYILDGSMWRRLVKVETLPERERELFIDNLLVRIHFIIVMIRWTGLAPWDGQMHHVVHEDHPVEYEGFGGPRIRVVLGQICTT